MMKVVITNRLKIKRLYFVQYKGKHLPMTGPFKTREDAEKQAYIRGSRVIEVVMEVKDVET